MRTAEQVATHLDQLAAARAALLATGDVAAQPPVTQPRHDRIGRLLREVMEPLGEAAGVSIGTPRVMTGRGSIKASARVTAEDGRALGTLDLQARWRHDSAGAHQHRALTTWGSTRAPAVTSNWELEAWQRALADPEVRRELAAAMADHAGQSAGERTEGAVVALDKVVRLLREELAGRLHQDGQPDVAQVLAALDADGWQGSYTELLATADRIATGG